jgi:hypothetical protein
MFEVFCYTAAIVFVLWIRATPATAIEAPTAPQPQPIIEAMPETTPAPAMAHTITEPVVSVTIRTEAPKGTEAPADLATLTSAELRRRCQSAGVKWRNAHGTRHLSKAEMVQALAA